MLSTGRVLLTIFTLICLMAVSRQRSLPADIKPHLPHIFLSLQSFDTGYKHKETYTEAKVLLWDSAVVEDMVTDLYGQLVCYYVFLTLQHHRLTDYDVPPTPTSTFAGESTTMLTVMFSQQFGVPDQMMSPLWLIHTYESYLQLSGQHRSAAVGEHDLLRPALSAALAEYATANCAPNNTYNGLHPGSANQRNLALLGYAYNCASPVFKDTLSQSLAANRSLIADSRRHLLTSAADVGGEWFSLDALYLNKVVDSDDFMTALLRGFGAQDTLDTAQVLRELFDQVARQNRPDRWAKRLGRFLEKFVDALKVVLLRIVCKHLVYLNERLPSGNIWYKGFDWHWMTALCWLGEYNGVFRSELNRAVEYLGLTEDPDLQMLQGHFLEGVTTFFARNFRDRIIDKIAVRMNVISPPLHFEVSCTKHFEAEPESGSIINDLIEANNFEVRDGYSIQDIMLQRSTMTLEAFVQYLQLSLVGVDMKVIRSFIVFAKDLKEFEIDPARERVMA